MKAKSEKEFRELRETQNKTSLEIDKLSKQVKEVTQSFNRWTKNQASIIENIFFESLRDDMSLDNVFYNEIILNLEIQKKETDLNQEFDIILKNGSQIALIETKSTLTVKDLEQLESMI